MIAVFGDIHGAITEMDEAVQQDSDNIEAVLQVGDFGIWPDHSKLDKKTEARGSAGDFRDLLLGSYRFHRPTFFCKGNHEDYDYLGEFVDVAEILPNLFYCPNGTVLDIYGVRCGFIGGSFAPSKFQLAPWNMKERGRRHQHECEFDSVATQGPIDLLVMHESISRDGSVYCKEYIERTGAKVVYSGHHHFAADYKLNQFEIHQMALIGRPGWKGYVTI